MNDFKPRVKFWIGNGILAVALLMLLFIGPLWTLLGTAVIVLWILLVGVGIYFLMKGTDEPPTY